MTFAIANVVSVNPLNASELIATFGVIGVLAIIFAETGLLIGFFFPGDSLLFLGGIAASPFAAKVIPGIQPLSLPALLIGAPVCAIAGAQLGHFLGRPVRAAHVRQAELASCFKPEYVEKAEHYFEKFGAARAVILARFIPIVRTFLNPVAGMLEMPARKFFVYNVIGGLIWTDAILLLGYGLAKRLTAIPNIDKYMVPAVIFIVLLSCIPIFIEVIRTRRERKRNPAGSVRPAHRAESAEAADTPDAEGRHRA